MYFITICTANRECFFGDIIVETQCIASPLHFEPENKIQLNNLGNTVESEWLKTPSLRSDMNIELAEYVVMPNHFHGIIIIGDNQYNIAQDRRGDNGDAMHFEDATDCVSTNESISDAPKNKFGPQYKNLASAIRGFKSAVTTFARKNDIPFDWQARFHDHIITTNDEYLKIANYIINNPENWQKDKFYKI